MRWFRSNRRPAGWLALLALAVQLVLSFDHVHVAHADHPEAAVSTAASPSGDDAAPGRPNSGHHHEDDYCAIYAVMAMLGGAQTASAPVLAVPAALASAEIAIPTEALDLASPRAAFRSRAPPLS